MVTRRTMMKTRRGAKPSAARSGNARSKAVRANRRAPAVDLHHTSAAEVGARLDAVENRALMAARRVARAGRHSMLEVLTAAKAVRLSAKEAVVAVRRAMRNIAKQVFAVTESVWPTTKAL